MGSFPETYNDDHSPLPCTNKRSTTLLKAFLALGESGLHKVEDRGDWFESWQTSKLRTKIVQVCDTQADRSQSWFF